MFGRFLKHLGCQLVSFAESLAQVAALEINDALPFLQRLSEQSLLAFLHPSGQFAENGGPTGQGLKAATVATTAFGTAHLDDHVPHLTRRAVETRIKLAIQDEAAADTGA